MSDLSKQEKRKLEKLLDMRSGYVLNFSDSTFADFVMDSTGLDIDDPRYVGGGTSKANRLRTFWNEEPNPVVGKLMNDLLDHRAETSVRAAQDDLAGHGALEVDDLLLKEGRRIVARLMQNSLVSEMDALTAITPEKELDVLTKEVREAIGRNQPEAGLDRLHTYVIKYIRDLCILHGLAVPRDKALHSLFGEYVKHLHKSGYIESVMTERILKSSISILEAFNHVRNDQSLAHDNPILNYDESMLIFSHVNSLLRFLGTLESKIRSREGEKIAEAGVDEIPF